MRMIFVRHGQADYKQDCLTASGHRQAQAVAERLREEPISKVYASTSGRAVETARYIAQKQGLSVAEQYEFMRELRWGSCEEMPIPHRGHPWYTVADMVAAGESVVSTRWQEEDAFRQNTKLLALVEPIGEQFDRLLSEYGLEREGAYYRLQCRNDSTVVMVSHAGSSGMVLSHLFNLPFPFLCTALSPHFTAVTIVAFEGEEGELISPTFEIVNDARHIALLPGEKTFGN